MLLFFIAVFTTTVIVGCGESDPGITGPEDGVITAEISIHKTTEYPDGKAKDYFYLKSDVKVSMNLPILVTHNNGESELIMIEKGDDSSKKVLLNGKTEVNEGWMRGKMPLPARTNGGWTIPVGTNWGDSPYIVNDESRQVS